jgi:hypothetical protein
MAPARGRGSLQGVLLGRASELAADSLTRCISQAGKLGRLGQATLLVASSTGPSQLGSRPSALYSPACAAPRLSRWPNPTAASRTLPGWGRARSCQRSP